MKIKIISIFYNETLAEFEDRVNDFISQAGIYIKDIKFVDGSAGVKAMVIYSDKER